MRPAVLVRARVVPALRPALLLAALAVCGCATAPPLPAFFTSAGLDAPRFPRTRFIAEVGTSTTSAGDADAQAHAQVSGRISSRLSAETDDFLRASSARGESQTVTQRIHVTTSFAHDELIHVVQRDARDGTFYALAALDRAEADAALARDAQQDAVNFAAFADRALLARAQGNSGDFASAAREADKLRGALDAAFIERRAVRGEPCADEEKFRARRDRLLAAEADARTRRVVEIRIDGPGARDKLLKLAVAAVRKLGLRVAVGMKCEDASAWSAQDATELVLEPEEVCGEGELGERCEVSVRLHARGCGSGGGAGEGRIAQVRGLNPSDRDRARASAWKRVLTGPVVDAAVRDALKGAAYLSCDAAGC